MPHEAGVERAGDAKRPRERPTPLGKLEASEVGMQPRTPTWQPVPGIGNDAHLPVDPAHHHPQQIQPGPATSTPHTRAHRGRASSHQAVYR